MVIFRIELGWIFLWLVLKYVHLNTMLIQTMVVSQTLQNSSRTDSFKDVKPKRQQFALLLFRFGGVVGAKQVQRIEQRNVWPTKFQS